MTDYKHLQPELQSAMAFSKAERIELIDQPRWIGYPRATDILDALSNLLHKPKRPRMPNLLIVGESNNGKTTLINHFGQLSGKSYVNQDGDPVRPVIIAEAPSSADEKALYMAILDRFWTPYRPTDSLASLRYQALHLMRACHVQMLVIDELHSLLAGTAAKQREVMNAIKRLCNELCIPIVGAGTPEAVRILHTDPQHASRFDVATLPTWPKDVTFQRLLASFEKILPLQKPSQLHTPRLAAELHHISAGNLGNLYRLLAECAKEAIESGKECIDETIIRRNQWIRPTKGIRELFG